MFFQHYGLIRLNMLIIHEDPTTLNLHISLVCKLFLYLGFLINLKKTSPIPTQCITFLGFVLDSVNLTISLPQSKIQKISSMCRTHLSLTYTTRRELAKLLGNLTSIVPAIPHAPLHYRDLQALLIDSRNQDWDHSVTYTLEAKSNLQWWVTHIASVNGAPWHLPPPEITISTDASKTGWGATCSHGPNAGDFWSPVESNLHINVLELLAIKHALMSIPPHIKNTHIRIRSDNTTALAYVGKMGGTRNKALSDIAIQIWNQATSNNIQLSCQHIPGNLNHTPDVISRMTDRADYMLKKSIFLKIAKIWGPFNMDLFARNWNAQTKKFYSWMKHPNSQGADALSQIWPKSGAYAFPPYIIIPKVLDLINHQKLHSITLIAPIWKAQSFYSLLLLMSTDYPIRLPPSPEILTDRLGNPDPITCHLAAWKLSGVSYKSQAFREKLLKLSYTNNGLKLNLPTSPLGQNGLAGTWKGIMIPFNHLSQIS